MDYAGDAVLAKFEAVVEPVTSATDVTWRVSGGAMRQSLAESATDERRPCRRVSVDVCVTRAASTLAAVGRADEVHGLNS